MMLAIIASAMLGLGLIPPYFELAKRNGRVIGIGKAALLLLFQIYSVKRLTWVCRFHLSQCGFCWGFLLLDGIGYVNTLTSGSLSEWEGGSGGSWLMCDGSCSTYF